MKPEYKSRWLPAIVSGLMLSAAFPKAGVSAAAWFALVPLFMALRGADRVQAFKIGMLAGFVHYLTLLYWVVITMRTYGYLPWWQCVSLLVLLAAYLALYPGFFSLMVTQWCRKPGYILPMAPVCWIALEYMRSFMLTGFPWGILGYSQFNRLHIIQISDMFGVYGVSFLVVLGNAAAYTLLLLLTRKAWRGHTVDKFGAFSAALLPLMLIGLTLYYGNRRIASLNEAMPHVASTRVAVIQGNIDQARKWDPAFQISTTKKYVDLTLSIAERPPDLIIWPETATPFYFTNSPKLTRLVIDAVREVGAHLLVGSPSVQTEPHGQAYYNSAYLVSPEGRTIGRYDKVHLVPFGEYVPLKRVLSFVGKMVAQVGDFSAGQKGRTLAMGDNGPSLGVQICFEIIFPGLSRSLVNNGAGLLVNLTNDAWFGRSSATYQHFSMVVFRAVENRRSLVRCANTGISGIVDPTGRILAPTKIFEDAVVDQRVPLWNGATLYTRMGDVMPLACLVLVALMIGRSTMRAWRRQPSPETAGLIDRIQQLATRLIQKRR